MEKWWVDRVQEHFAAKPLVFKLDSSKSVRAAIRDLIQQAEKRQEEMHGATIVGAILQHLVGAKLSILLPNPPQMFGASVADAVSDRAGDFVFEDVVIHVTTAPMEALFRKCQRNLDEGLKPIVITTYRKLPQASGLAEEFGIADRVDIFDIEQFIAGNIYELGKFNRDGRRNTTQTIVDKYNELVSTLENDPALKISLGE